MTTNSNNPITTDAMKSPLWDHSNWNSSGGISLIAILSIKQNRVVIVSI